MERGVSASTGRGDALAYCGWNIQLLMAGGSYICMVSTGSPKINDFMYIDIAGTPVLDECCKCICMPHITSSHIISVIMLAGSQ